jgi:CheY-like chemotaxis protein
MYAKSVPSSGQELEGNEMPEARPTNHGWVLVVDDDVDIHTLLEFVLRPLQLDIRCAVNGYEALGMAAISHPSLIILDLMMPGLDGFSLLEHLSGTDETANIPVIIFSARLDVYQLEDREWPPQVVGVLEKSKLYPSEFRDLVRGQLSGHISPQTSSDGRGASPNPDDEMQDQQEGYILIVDDDPDTRETLSAILEDSGLVIRTATDGGDALSHVRRKVPDLILMDLMMPGMDGFQFFSRLRSLPSTRHVPVVVVSAYSVGQEEMLKLPGIAQVMAKGRFGPAELVEVVDNLLGPRHSPQPAW